MRKNKVGGVQNGFSIFTLDDDTTITAALKAYFESNGYQVDTGSDPIQALESMKEKQYDILLLDYLMSPIRGDEVVTRLRQFNTDIFIILLTGHKELAPPLDTIRELDIQGYYEKSERFDQLELLVESCVKAIRQMRVIRNYRDGLNNVILSSEKINILSPLNEIMQRVLAESFYLTNANEGFLFLFDKKKELKSFQGAGRYSLSKDHFVTYEYPLIKENCLSLHNQGKVFSLEKLLLVPLFGTEIRDLGILGISSETHFSDSTSQLISLFGRQAESALQNATLHEDLERAYSKLHDSYIETITTLRLLVDAKDIYTRGHSDRTSLYAVKLAKALGCPVEILERVRVSSLFHDVGKIGTADAILNKNGKLDDREYSEIKQHPMRGAKIISSLSMFNDLADIISAHHERYDGNGYPQKLKGEEIPYEARIIAVTDAFDAMTSGRNYGGQDYENALEELRQNRFTQFDGNIVDVFLSLLKDQGDEIRSEIQAASKNDAVLPDHEHHE